MGQSIQEWTKLSLRKTAFKKFEVIWSAFLILLEIPKNIENTKTSKKNLLKNCCYETFVKLMRKLQWRSGSVEKYGEGVHFQNYPRYFTDFDFVTYFTGLLCILVFRNFSQDAINDPVYSC